MNPELRDILSQVARIRAQQVVSLREQVAARREVDLERFIKERAARMLAEEITQEIFGKGQVARTQTFDGDMFSVEGSFLTYDQLYRLVEGAYNLGRRDSAHTPTFKP